jgi:hypothetical protein
MYANLLMMTERSTVVPRQSALPVKQETPRPVRSIRDPAELSADRVLRT